MMALNAEISGFGGMDTIDREAMERLLGLDVPAHVQYGRWMGVLPTPDWITGESRFRGLLQGTLGESLVTSHVTVEKEIFGRLPVTIQLGIMAVVIGLVIALPVGIYSAIRQDTAADYLGRTAAVIDPCARAGRRFRRRRAHSRDRGTHPVLRRYRADVLVRCPSHLGDGLIVA